MYLLSLMIGYLFGIIPSAYWVIKFTNREDITKIGSGNAGAMNTYDVTNSKLLFLIVFLIDSIKGLLPVYIMLIVDNRNFILPALALISAVMAHCYNPLLKFKGGRGLATAFGGTILLAPFIPVFWIFFWVLVYLIYKDILLANIIAILLTVLTIVVTADKLYYIEFLQSVKPESIASMILFSLIILIIIFAKHYEPLLEIIARKRK